MTSISKCYCFSHSTAPRMQNVFWSANHGDRQSMPIPFLISHTKTHVITHFAIPVLKPLMKPLLKTPYLNAKILITNHVSITVKCRQFIIQ